MLATTAIMVLATAANAYSYMLSDEGIETHWQEDAEVMMYLNPSNDQGLSEDEVEEAFLDAMDAWNAVGAGVTITYLGTTTSSGLAIDQANLVYFESDWDLGSDGVAYAQNGLMADEFIVATDIAINSDDYSWSVTGEEGAMDLQNALTHELGHCLGLDHSTEENATMFSTGEEGETLKRSLHPDDSSALLNMYPQTGGVVGCSSTGASPLASLGLLLALPALLARRRSR